MMDTDTTAHAALMSKWKNRPLHKGQVFIEDGIICLEKWKHSKNKVLILLKEAYGEEESWSLVETIRDVWKGPKYKVFWTIAYWLYLLNKIEPAAIPLFPATEKEFDACREYLLSAAVVNLKKSAGNSASNYDELLSYVRKDRKLLREQLEIINPGIILCGYTKEYFDLFWNRKTEKIKNTEFLYKSGNTIIIDFWHPANQYPDKLCYYALGAVCQKVITEEHIGAGKARAGESS